MTTHRVRLRREATDPMSEAESILLEGMDYSSTRASHVVVCVTPEQARMMSADRLYTIIRECGASPDSTLAIQSEEVSQ